MSGTDVRTKNTQQKQRITFPVRKEKLHGSDDVEIDMRPSRRPSCVFLPSYSHRSYDYKNEDVLVVEQVQEVADMLKIPIRKCGQVARRLTVETTDGCGDALVRIINGQLTYAVIICPYEPNFVQWVRENGYSGVIVAMDPTAPVERAIMEGFDGAIRRLDMEAMKGLMKMLKDVVKPDHIGEMSTVVENVVGLESEYTEVTRA